MMLRLRLGPPFDFHSCQLTRHINPLQRSSPHPSPCFTAILHAQESQFVLRSCSLNALERACHSISGRSLLSPTEKRLGWHGERQEVRDSHLPSALIFANKGSALAQIQNH